MITPALFNCLAGMPGETPLLDLPSVRTNTTFLAPLLAPAALLKMRLLRTYCNAVPVAVKPPVYLRKLIYLSWVLYTNAYHASDQLLQGLTYLSQFFSVPFSIQGFCPSTQGYTAGERKVNIIVQSFHKFIVCRSNPSPMRTAIANTVWKPWA